MSNTNLDTYTEIPGQMFSTTDGVAQPPVDSIQSSVTVRRDSGSTPGYGSLRRVVIRDTNRGNGKPPAGKNLEFSVVEKKRKLNRNERLQIAATSLKPLGFFYNKREFKYLEGSYRTTVGTSVSQLTGVIAHSVGGSFDGAEMSDWRPSPSERAAMKNRVIAKILEKLHDQKINVAQVFAERIKTADLVTTNATKIANCFLSLRRGNLKAAASHLGIQTPKRMQSAFDKQYLKDASGAAARAFLEIQYGWRPLLQDVYGAAEFIAQKQSHEIRNVVRSKISVKSSKDTSEKLAILWTPVEDYITFRERRYDMSCSLWFATSDSALATASQAGLLNPAQLVWELLPYSFVVDWFLPVGDYLKSQDAIKGLGFEKGCFTEFWETKQRRVIHAGNARDLVTGVVYDINGRASCREVYCERIVLDDFPSAPFPSMKNPVSFEHAANAIALLRSAFTSKRFQ